ncbi:MAG: helix-turn-helix domain-containing protein [Gemmatimonas sp.]
MGGEDNISAWREAVATLFDVDEFALADADRFRADIRSYAMGPVLLGLSRASGQRFRRTAETIARSGVDHIILQLYVKGGYDGVAGDQPMHVGAGDICLLDLAQTLDTRASAFENLTLVMPRPLFDAQLIKVEDLHGLVLPGDGVLAPLLARHLAALFEYAPRMTLDQCQSVAEGTISLIVACLRGELERRDADRSPTADASLFRIRQYIEARLADRSLSASSVAAYFGLSRASLYRLFMPVGGVAEYIRSRRLHRAFFDLAATGSRATRISQVARRWQLGTDAHFTRLFKAAYGITPSAAREAALLGPRKQNGAERADAGGSTISRWMREIAPPQAAD